MVLNKSKLNNNNYNDNNNNNDNNNDDDIIIIIIIITIRHSIIYINLLTTVGQDIFSNVKRAIMMFTTDCCFPTVNVPVIFAHHNVWFRYKKEVTK